MSTEMLFPSAFPLGSWLLKPSVQAAVMVPLVLLVQWVFRHQMSPRWRYALWWLVVIRLLLPVSLGSTASLYNWVRWPAPATAVVTSMQTPGAELLASSEPLFPSAPKLEAASPGEARPMTWDANQIKTAAAESAQPQPTPSESGSPAIVASPQAHSGYQLNWRHGLVMTWCMGVIVLLVHVARSAVRLRRQLRSAREITDLAILQLLEECRQQIQIRAAPTLCETGAVQSPALYGLLRPRLLLPPGLISSFTAEELRYVFLHELAHIKRRDMLANWLVTLLQICHWFNPLLWWGFGRMRADRELACDALALSAARPHERQAYGQTIIKLLEGFAQPSPLPGLVGILEDKDQMKQRIRMIARFRPAQRWGIVSALLIGGLGLVCLTDAQHKTPVVDNSPANPSSAPVAVSKMLPSSTLMKPRPVVTNGPTMKVIVVDGETGKPISGAEVLTQNRAPFYGTVENAPRWVTDATGTAMIYLGEISDLPTFQIPWFRLSVRKTGFAPRGLSWAEEEGDVRTNMPSEITVRLNPGMNIGGVVKNAEGAAEGGVRVRVFGCGYSYFGSRERHQEYDEFWSGSKEFPAAITDQGGRWEVIDFPRDLENVAIELIRPDGSSKILSHSSAEHNPVSNIRGAPLNLVDLRMGKAVLLLEPGFTVRGVVLDPQGKPLPNILVKEAYGIIHKKRANEFRTDAAGRFMLSNRAPRQMILTAYPQDFAITSTVVGVSSNTPEVRLQVAALRPLQIQVVDGANHPVSEAEIMVEEPETPGQVLDFEGATGPEGTLVWTNAPQAAFALMVKAPATGWPQKHDFRQMILKVSPTQRQITFKLREGMEQEIIVQAKARDAKTGAPVKVRAVSLQTMYPDGFSPLPEIGGSEFQARIPVSRFRQGMVPMFQLRLEAEGYETLVTPRRNFHEGDWTTEFMLQPGDAPGGTVVLANGRPAAGAQVGVRTQEIPLFMYHPDHVIGSDTQVVRTDQNGRFSFPYPGGNWSVVIVHKEGFLATTADPLKARPQLVLQPWGRVEGVLYSGTNLLSRPRISVEISGGHLRAGGWSFGFIVQPDRQGRFTFDRVPPGQNLLRRWEEPGLPPWDENSRSIPRIRGYQMPVAVKPGEIVQVRYGGMGRPITGRVAGEADWRRENPVLMLKVPPPPSPPNVEDFGSHADFEKAIDRYNTDRQQHQHLARTYPLGVKEDGSLRIEDVPAGTYELRTRVTDLRPGEFVREVVVPEMPGGRSDEPLDLGVLNLLEKRP